MLTSMDACSLLIYSRYFNSELQDQITELLPTETMLPAPAQGALAVEMRTGEGHREGAVAAAMAAVDDPATRAAVTAERQAVHSRRSSERRSCSREASSLESNGCAIELESNSGRHVIATSPCSAYAMMENWRSGGSD